MDNKKAIENEEFTVIAMESETLRVEFVDIGEGYGGDYNAEDPEDRRLMRLYALRRDQDADNSDWEEIEDGSCCTCIPSDTKPADLAVLLAHVFATISDAIQTGASMKRSCERLSWLCGVEDIKRINTTKVKTPSGFLIARKIGQNNEFPGVQISLSESGIPSDTDEVIAVVEYNHDDPDSIVTEVYAAEYEGPAYIIDHATGEDFL